MLVGKLEVVMGCFDSVFFKCPKCGGQVEAQSNARRTGASFSSNSVPLKVAADLVGDGVGCSKCGSQFTVVADLPSCVALELVSNAKADAGVALASKIGSLTGLIVSVSRDGGGIVAIGRLHTDMGVYRIVWRGRGCFEFNLDNVVNVDVAEKNIVLDSEWLDSLDKP